MNRLPTTWLVVACAALLALGLFAIAGPLSPPGGPVAPTMKTLDEVEARTPIDRVPASATAPHSITAPGTYYLTRDIVQLGAGNGVEIRADDVTLDLNGFRIVGTPGVSGAGVLAPVAVRNVKVHNGSVTGWSADGVSLELSRHATVENIFAHDNGRDGALLGDFTIVRNVHAASNGRHGINMRTNSLADSCIVEGNQGHGILAGPTNTVRNCNAASNGGDGIHVGNSSIVENCVSEGNTGAFASGGGNGIWAEQGVVIQGCLTVGNALNGVLTSSFCTVRNCHANTNGADGFNVNTAVLVQNCSATFNGDDGFQFRGSCRLTGNISQSNGFGFFDAAVADSASVLRDNTGAFNNFSGFLMSGSGALLARNTARGNAVNFAVTASNHQMGEIHAALGIIGSGMGGFDINPFANFEPATASPLTGSASGDDPDAIKAAIKQGARTDPSKP